MSVSNDPRCQDSPPTGSRPSGTWRNRTCLFEGTPLSVGRGTQIPFQHVGAPWIDGEALAAALNTRELPGVPFEATRFTPDAPSDGKFGGQEVGGVRFVATDPAVYDPTAAAVAALIEARRLSGDRWSWRADHFDLLAGTDALRLGIEAGREVEELTAGWAAQVEAFRARGSRRSSTGKEPGHGSSGPPRGPGRPSQFVPPGHGPAPR